ncbi:MAG: hypothetical protein HUU55_04960 [Myxococcales bacterium]|nr:hypothetical protein [Myxococcales bacterium]
MVHHGLPKNQQPALSDRAALLLCGDFAAVSRINPPPRVDFRLLNDNSTDPVPEHRWNDRELIDGNIVQATRVLLERFERLVPTLLHSRLMDFGDPPTDRFFSIAA